MRVSAFLWVFFCLITFALAQDTNDLPTGVTIHIVQRGESLWRIARDYGVAIETLAQLNGLPPTSGIFAGQRLLVPDTTFELSTLSPQPVVVDTVHTVLRGETLFRIATAYGLTVSELTSANDIRDPSLIYAGQQLLIPARGTSGEASSPEVYPAPVQTVRVRPSTFVEGQAASVVITTSVPSTVSVTFLDETTTAIADAAATTHTFLRGIPMFATAGQFPLRISAQGGGQSATIEIPITVATGRYFTTNISISADQAALLAPAVEEFEIGTLRTITSQINTTRAFTGLMGLPAAAAMNAPFGTRRSYNGGPVNRYHNGADFATPPGSPVFAAAPGRVVLADMLNIRGNAIMIDHGWGIYTLYAHLTSLGVGLGDMVTMGQVIGTSGSTGRVTGPHLHWEVWVAGVSVDPMLWTQQVYP